MSFFRRVTRAITAVHLLPIVAGVAAGAAAYRYYNNQPSGNRQSQFQSQTQSQEAYSPRTEDPQPPRHEAANPSPPSHIPQNPSGSTPGRTQVTILPRDTTQIYQTPNRDRVATPVEADRGQASVTSALPSASTSNNRGTVR